jgi:hypothetical protein
MMMAFNLPAAWDPGFVLPQNVHDEGLQRRGLVTKQMPRGTYDNPSVGTGGFAVPQYVRDEGYGQGTFTTKWQPSGSYNGPAIPNWLNQRPKVVRTQRIPGGGRMVTVQAMGDDAPMPLVFDQYGTKAAQALLARVSTLPPGRRQSALKTIMAQVDKSLWTRTQDITKRYLSQGMPLVQAFPAALARALSTGIAAEIIDTGLRRTAPQAKSLLGLGCYGPQALGLITVADGGTTGDPTDGGRVIPVPGTGWKPPLPGTPDPERAPPTPLPDLVRVGGFAFDPHLLKRTWAPGSQASATIAHRDAPPDAVITDPGQVPPETLAFLRSFLLAKDSSDPLVTYKSSNAMTGYASSPDATPWFVELVGEPPPLMRMHPLWWLRTTIQPFARVHNPYDGTDMVLHLNLERVDRSKVGHSTTNPLQLKAWLSHVPPTSVWQTLLNTLTYIPMTVGNAIGTVTAPVITPVVKAGIELDEAIKDAIHDGLNELGDLACEVMQKPGVGAAAGAVAGTYIGAGPVAGAAAGQAGAEIAKQSCGAPPPPPAPPIAISSSAILPLAILAGGAVLVAIMAGRKRTS